MGSRNPVEKTATEFCLLFFLGVYKIFKLMEMNLNRKDGPWNFQGVPPPTQRIPVTKNEGSGFPDPRNVGSTSSWCESGIRILKGKMNRSNMTRSISGRESQGQCGPLSGVIHINSINYGLKYSEFLVFLDQVLGLFFLRLTCKSPMQKDEYRP